MSGGWWCCCQGCWIWTDDFNRANTTDISLHWNEVRGDWGVQDYHLVERYAGTATASGSENDPLVIMVHPQPLASAGEQWIQVEIWNPVTGDLDYIFPCCVDIDTVGSVEVEFHCTNAPADWTVTIRKGAQEVTESIVANVESPNPNDRYVTAWVCADDVAIMVKAGMSSTGQPPIWADTFDPGSYRYVGLGHSNFVTGVTYDDFLIEELRKSTTICQVCFCRCEDTYPTKILHAAFLLSMGTGTSTAGNRAACLSGAGFQMDWEYSGASELWRGEYTSTHNPLHPSTLRYSLICGSYDPANPFAHFTLRMDDTKVCCSSGVCGPFTPDVRSTCEPLNLIFGPFQMSPSDLMCFLCEDPIPLPPFNDPGEYYLVVTE